MGDAPTPNPPAHVAEAIVLDTNAVLDLWLFDDAKAVALRDALASGRLRWIATSTMLTELDHVLKRPFVAAWWARRAGDAAELANRCAAIPARAHMVELPPTTPHEAPRCTDPDDQPFLDLAWRVPTRWLVSHDRALLAVARPALELRGLRIGPPASWTG